MKAILILLVVFFGLDLPLHSQISLNPGDAYTYEFTTLSLGGTAFSPPRGCFGVDMSIPVGGQVRYEAFENNVSDVPWGSGEIAASQGLFTCGQQKWQDLQGVVRFTVLSGSAQLNSMQFEVLVNFDAIYFTSVVPVPEPSVLGLFGVGFMASGVFKLLCRHR